MTFEKMRQQMIQLTGMVPTKLHINPKSLRDLPKEEYDSFLRAEARGELVITDKPPKPVEILSCPECDRIYEKAKQEEGWHFLCRRCGFIIVLKDGRLEIADSNFDECGELK